MAGDFALSSNYLADSGSLASGFEGAALGGAEAFSVIGILEAHDGIVLSTNSTLSDLLTGYRQAAAFGNRDRMRQFGVEIAQIIRNHASAFNRLLSTLPPHNKNKRFADHVDLTFLKDNPGPAQLFAEANTTQGPNHSHRSAVIFAAGGDAAVANGKLEVFNRSKILQGFVLAAKEADPVTATVSFLLENKTRIDWELGRVYSYKHLMGALVAGGKTKGNPQTYKRAGSALDLFFAMGNPMQALSPEQFKTPEEAVEWLIVNKSTLDPLAKRVDEYSYNTLMCALVYGGKTKGNPQTYQRAGGALDLYFTPNNPMQALTQEQFKTPEEAVKWLIENKDKLDHLAHQRVDEYSYRTLMDALIYGRKTKGNPQIYMRAGGALDIYFAPNNPMQALTQEQFKTPKEAIKWLIENKTQLDRTIHQRVDEYSYSTLMSALVYGGKTTGNRMQYLLDAGVIQYLSQKWPTVESLVRKVERGERLTQDEKDLFTTLKGNLPISRSYRDRILSYGVFLIRENLIDALVGK